MKPNQFFVLYACCIPVKGYHRSIICDLQRKTFEFIPNELYNILKNVNNLSIGELSEKYNIELEKSIEEYLIQLIEGEYGFTTDEPELFPSIDLKWNTPYTIQNAIVDVDKSIHMNFDKIFNELNLLNCQAIQLRFYNIVSKIEIETILSLLDSTRIKSVEILIKYDTIRTLEDAKQLCMQFGRLLSITVHSAPFDRQITGTRGAGNILSTQQVIDSETHCGIISPVYFSINLPHFAEAQEFNTCLKGKISIDKNGEIKNCPSLPKSYGNISNVSLLDVVRNEKSFISLWTVNKDQIEVCQDCEFRYICSDCRAYIEDPYNILSKPSKCSYDPYKGVWK